MPAPVRAAVEGHADRRRAALRLPRPLLRHHGQVRADSRTGAHLLRRRACVPTRRRAPPPGLDLDGRPGARRRRRSCPTCTGSTIPAWVASEGYHRVEADYRLLNDNLLDLSHETYVHTRTIGHEAVAESPIAIKVGDALGPHRQGNARLHAAAVLSVSRPASRPPTASTGWQRTVVRAARIHRDRRRRAGAGRRAGLQPASRAV